MRILVTSLPDIKRITPQRYQHLLSYLARDHEVTVFCVNAWWLPERPDEYLLALIDKLDISYVTDQKINPVLQELCLAHKFSDRIDKGSFEIYLNVNCLIAGYIVTQKMKRRGIPTIFDIGDDLPKKVKVAPQIPPVLKPAGYTLANSLFKKCIAASARNTVVTRSLLRSYHFPLDRTVIVPNGVDTQLFRSDATCSKQSEQGIQGTFVLGFLGNLRPEVNLEPAFGALRSLVRANYDVTMMVVGDGEKLAEFKRLALKYEIADRVLFTGSVSSRDLSAYLAGMDAGIIAYEMTEDNQNAGPLKLLEYMASGKPVISADIRGVREVAEARALYATDADEIAQTVQDLYNHPEKGVTLGREGREFVATNYSWERIGACFERVIHEVANE
jgi:glycosyltransferase involved in cell wall biosynthesis